MFAARNTLRSPAERKQLAADPAADADGVPGRSGELLEPGPALALVLELGDEGGGLLSQGVGLALVDGGALTLVGELVLDGLAARGAGVKLRGGNGRDELEPGAGLAELGGEVLDAGDVLADGGGEEGLELVCGRGGQGGRRLSGAVRRDLGCGPGHLADIDPSGEGAALERA